MTWWIADPPLDEIKTRKREPASDLFTELWTDIFTIRIHISVYSWDLWPSMVLDAASSHNELPERPSPSALGPPLLRSSPITSFRDQTTGVTPWLCPSARQSLRTLLLTALTQPTRRSR